MNAMNNKLSNAINLSLIEGRKAGESQRKAVEAPDSLSSIAHARVIDLISEGEIEGFPSGNDDWLRDVYIDSTPVQNADGTKNFKNFFIEARMGTQTQSHIPGFAAVENEVSIGVELRADTPWTRSFSDTTLSAVRVRLAVAALSYTDNETGDIKGHRVEYALDISTDGGPFVEALKSSFNGKTSDLYERGHRLNLPPASVSGWIIRARRITPDTTSTYIQDTTLVSSVTEIIDGKFRYPNSAIVGLQIDASQFQSIPSRAYHLLGRRVKVPTNYDPIARTYATSGAGTSGGAWDGTFKTAWTNNPAWVYYDMATHQRYGLGHIIDPALVDKWSLYGIAQYCDEMVPDGFGGMEPRMTCNVYLQKAADAWKLMSDLASVFRGISYWASGSIVPIADRPTSPVYTYNNSNVVDGVFTYESSGRRARHSAVLIGYHDMGDMGRIKFDYYDDPYLIDRFGFQLTETVAMGSTSRGQARRMARWMLASERYLTNLVTFGVGLDGTKAMPGQVVRIADRHRAGRRMGGRIAGATLATVTLDRLPEPPPAIGDSITVILPTGVSETRVIGARNALEITPSSPFSQVPSKEGAWAIESADLKTQLFRILSVTDASDLPNVYSLTALQHNPDIFDYVDLDEPITEAPISNITNAIPAPSNLQVSIREAYIDGVLAKIATFSWDKVPGAVGYDVSWSQSEGNWNALGRVTTTSTEVIVRLEGTLFFKISSVNVLGVPSVPKYSDPFTVLPASQLNAFDYFNVEEETATGIRTLVFGYNGAMLGYSGLAEIRYLAQPYSEDPEEVLPPDIVIPEDNPATEGVNEFEEFWNTLPLLTGGLVRNGTKTTIPGKGRWSFIARPVSLAGKIGHPVHLIIQLGDTLEEVITGIGTTITEIETLVNGRIDGIVNDIEGPGGIDERIDNLITDTDTRINDIVNDIEGPGGINETITDIVNTATVLRNDLTAEVNTLTGLINTLDQNSAAARSLLQQQLDVLNGEVAVLTAQIGDIMLADDWAVDVQYYYGEMIKHLGYLYRALQDNIGNEPGVSGSEAYWQLIGQYNSMGEAMAASVIRLNLHDTRFDEVEGDVSLNASNLSALAVEVAGKATIVALNQVSADVQINEDNISSVAQDLSAITNTVNDPTTGLAATVQGLNALTLTVTTHDGTLTTHGQDISSLKAKVGGEVLTSVYRETFGSGSIADWTLVGATVAEIVYQQSPDALGGTTVLIGDNVGDDDLYIRHVNKKPSYDPSKLYRVRVRAKRIVGGGNDYIGFFPYTAAGAAAGAGNGNVYCLHTGSLSPVGEWVEIDKYVSGVTTDSSWSGTGTLADPIKMPLNTASIAPLMLLRWANNAGQTELDYFLVDEVEDVTLAEAVNGISFNVQQHGDTISSQAQSITSLLAQIGGSEVLGPELIPDFLSDTANGAVTMTQRVGVTKTIVNGELVLTAADGNNDWQSWYLSGITIGAKYRVTVELKRGTQGTKQAVNDGGAPGWILPLQYVPAGTGYSTLTWDVVPTNTQPRVFVWAAVSGGAAGDSVVVKSVSVRRVNPSTLAGAVNNLTVDVQQNADGITAVASRTTDLELAVADPDTGLQASADAIDALQLTVTQNGEDITLHGVRLTSLEGTVNNAETGVVATANALQALTIEVSTVDGKTIANASAITALQLTVDDPENGVNAHTTAIDGINTSIQTINGDITAHAGRLTTLEATVNDAETGVSATATALAALTTDVGLIDGRLTAAAADIVNIQAKLGPDILGPELVPGGEFNSSEDTTGWSTLLASLTVTNGAMHVVATQDGQSDRTEYTLTNLEVGSQYKVLVRAKRGAQGTTQILTNWTWGVIQATSITTTEFQDYEFTVTATATSGLLRIYASTSGAVGDEVIVDKVSVRKITTLNIAEALNALTIEIQEVEGGAVATAQELTDLKAVVEDPTTGLAAVGGALQSLTTTVGNFPAGGFTSVSQAITSLTASLGDKADASALQALSAEVGEFPAGVFTSASQAVLSLQASLDDKADASAVQTLTATVGTFPAGGYTSVSSAVTALKNSVDGKAESSAVQTLDSRVGATPDGYVSFSAAYTALNNTVAGKASSSALSTLDSRVGPTPTGYASFSAAYTALENTLDGKAESSALQALISEVGDFPAGGYTSAASAVTALKNSVDGKAESSVVQTLDSRVGATPTGYTSFSLAFTGLKNTVDGKASASALTTLDNRVGSTPAGYTSFSLAFTGLKNEVDGKASASAFTTLENRVGPTPTGYTTFSQAVTEVKTTADGAASWVNTNATAVNGLFSKFTLTVGSGNVITGFESVNNGGITSFKIRSDRFEIVPSTTVNGALRYANSKLEIDAPNGVHVIELGVF